MILKLLPLLRWVAPIALVVGVAGAVYWAGFDKAETIQETESLKKTIEAKEKKDEIARKVRRAPDPELLDLLTR